MTPYLGFLMVDRSSRPRPAVNMNEVIRLEIDGQPVTVTIEREQSDLAPYGYPADHPRKFLAA